MGCGSYRAARSARIEGQDSPGVLEQQQVPAGKDIWMEQPKKYTAHLLNA